MIEALLKIAAALLPLIIAMLMEDRDATPYEKKIDRFDRALADRDTDYLSGAFDRLRIPTGPVGPGGGYPGGPGDPADG